LFTLSSQFRDIFVKFEEIGMSGLLWKTSFYGVAEQRNV